MADAIGGDYGWPTAISNFEKSHKIVDGAWVAKKENVSFTTALKETDGHYRLIGISTAALKDLDGETFTTKAIDYDIAQAKTTGNYPEFRMFHTDGLGIGRVDKMQRVGVFAVDSGHSYDDPFSLACCEAIAKDDSGKWRMSRGFYLLEASGGCPSCGEQLLLKQRHLVAFKCPNCGSTRVYGKKGLADVRFLKTRTFDVTVTDHPCVPYTGVTAFKFSDDYMEVGMNKTKLKQKLLEAGVPEDVVDERLATVTEKQIENLDDVPTATLLKEVGLEEDASQDQEAIDYDQLIEGMGELVEKKVKKALDELEIELAVPEFKEFEQLDGRLTGIETVLKELKESIDALTASDEERLKGILKEAPRAAKYRVLRYKASGKKKMPMMDDEDMEDGGDDEEAEGEAPAPFPPKKKKSLDPDDGVVYTPTGQFSTLSEALIGGK